jgi:hypothetical protein
VAEEAQRVAEADLPAQTGSPQLGEKSPRSGEYQINVTPNDAYPDGTGPNTAPSPAPAAPAGAGVHQP